MKLWHFAALLTVLGIVYFAVTSIKKTSSVTKAKSNANASATNQIFANLATGLGGLVSHLGAPSAQTGSRGGLGLSFDTPTVNEGTYINQDPSEFQTQGNQLVDSDNIPLQYGTD